MNTVDQDAPQDELTPVIRRFVAGDEDAIGTLWLTITDPLDLTTSYSYDLDGEELSVTNPDGNTTHFAYNALGRLASETLPTLSGSGGGTMATYTYAASLVGQESRTWASGSSTDTVTYTYTNNDQLTGVSHTNGSFASESFTYDANGNETGTGYTTATGNEQTASPGYTYTFDADGNMITSTQTSTGDVWTYSYDFRNRLVGAVEKSSGGTTLEQVTYTYDALDNRIGMDENGTQTWTLHDGGEPIMDFNSSGSLTMRYLNGPAGDVVDTVLARESSGGTIAWYLSDRLGTIRNLINNSGGIIDHVDYSAFGTVLNESSPTSGDRMMGFAGMRRDTVTGLNLAVNRVHDPGTGRWDSEDPDGFAGGDSDLYRYVENGPTDAVDPSGLKQGMGSMRPGGPGHRPRGKRNGRRIYDPLADQIKFAFCVQINISSTLGSLVLLGPALVEPGLAPATNPEIMRQFFRGGKLACTQANARALRWYLKIARDALARYRGIGYTGPGVATQTQRIAQILEQLRRWGLGE